MDIDQWSSYIESASSLRHGQYSVTRLEGGYLNSTVRLCLNETSLPFQLTLRHSDNGNDYTLHDRSLVLKHYPPYMYAWPDAPLTPHRCAVEATALQVLVEEPALRHGFASEGMIVPTVIHLDELHNVLWLKDLGSHRSLVDWFSDQPLQDGQDGPARALGSRIGRWLASLHLATMDPDSRKLFVVHMTSPAGKSALDEHQEISQDLFKAHDTAVDASELTKLAQLDHSPIIGLPGLDVASDELCYGMGDVWPGSFLVLSDPPDTIGGGSLLERKAPAPRLAVVDWEFFGPTHPASELATLTGRFYAASLDKGSKRGDIHYTHATSLLTAATALCESYIDVFRRSPHSMLMKRNSWTERAETAWARVLLNAARNAAEDSDERRSPITEAIDCLRPATQTGSPKLSKTFLDLIRQKGP